MLPQLVGKDVPDYMQSRHVPEGIAVQSYCRENLKSQCYFHFRRSRSIAKLENLGKSRPFEY
jgi:hypothetical protein